MSDDLIDAIKDGVRTDLGALGPDPEPVQVADVVGQHARHGAGGDARIGNQAAAQAREYLDQGVGPEDSAALAGARAHQDVVGQRRGIQAQANDLITQQGSDGPAVPSVDAVDNQTALSNQGIDPGELATTKSVMARAGESMSAVGLSPPVAAQAELAIANAASGGQALPSGLDIHGNLKVTVHDYVKLSFESSQIKTTKGPTTYTHKDDVDIRATNVRLTADTILIEPSVSETNWVKGSKSSYRKYYSVNIGLSSTTTTTDDHVTLYGASAAIAPLTIHIAPVKVGAAYRMVTRGKTRDGIMAMTYENSDAMSRKSNVHFMLASILLIFF